MKQKNKIIFVSLLVILTLSTIFNTSYATNVTVNNTNQETTENAENTEELNLYAQSCLLVERKSHKIIYAKNADTKIYPASTTKILTALIALEKCNLTDTVTITSDMVYSIPSGYKLAYLPIGKTVTVEQLLNLLLIPSTNDPGYALAIHISGSIDNFAVLMNEKAAQLGCVNSHFTNPCGVHSENHYTTATDMGIIALKAMENETLTTICSTPSYEFNGKVFDTTNTLMKADSNSFYEYVNGLKTGYTGPAGSCIIATASKEDMNYMALVFNAPEPTSSFNYRDADCKTLFDYAFENHYKLAVVEQQTTEFVTNFFSQSIQFNNILKIGLSVLFVCCCTKSAISSKSSGKRKTKRKK